MLTNIFVYGTLRRLSRHPMAHYLAERGRFVAEARVPGKLYQLGRYPGLVPCRPEEGWARGEVYELSDVEATLREIDRYEKDESTGEATFERAPAEVMLADGSEVKAWVYWFHGTVEESQRIASGDYCDVLM